MLCCSESHLELIVPPTPKMPKSGKAVPMILMRSRRRKSRSWACMTLLPWDRGSFSRQTNSRAPLFFTFLAALASSVYVARAPEPVRHSETVRYLQMGPFQDR